MRRRLGVFAVIGAAQLALATLFLLACDLGLTPFADPDATVAPPPTGTNDAAGGTDSATVVVDASAPVTDAAVDTGTPFPFPDGGKLIFVSSVVTTGAMGGTAGADSLCQGLAAKAKLDGTFIAWLSVTGAPALGRLTSTGPWFLTDRKTRVFKSKASIPTTFAEAVISLDETGKKPLAFNGLAWTNTTSTGAVAGETLADGCAGFNVEDGVSSIAGSIAEKGPKWTESGSAQCTTALHLYCLEP